ncbi:MAG: hypothetical protein P8101_00300 [Candidatus Thiodiazotropha sp.]
MARKRSNPASPRRLYSHPRSWWLEHYHNWQSSDLSKSAYCTKQGLNISSFSNWTTRFQREASENSASAGDLTFFKMDTQSGLTSPSGEVRALSVQGVSLTFERPIGSEALLAWVRVIKSC